MSDRIPPEVLTNILVQCEIQTILRCRCVSKQWRAIIDDTHFIKQHTDYSIKSNSNRLFFKSLFSDLCHSSLDYPEICHVPIISQVQPSSLVGSCNGLLCLRNAKDPQYFCIMNPTTRKQICLRGLFPSKDYKTRVHRKVYGFGYDCVSDDYKVVRIAQQELDSEANIQGPLETEMSIFYLKRRVLKVVKFPYFVSVNTFCLLSGGSILINTSGVLAAGSLHWTIIKFNGWRSPWEIIIVGYDLGTDEFRELRPPNFVNKCRVSIGLLGTWLCISAYYGAVKGIDFWVMKEYGVKESWTKLFSFPLNGMSCGSVRPLGLAQRGSLVLLELDGNRLAWYDIEEKEVTNFSHKSREEAFVCLSSLAPLPSNENGGINENNQCFDSEDEMKTRKKHKVCTSEIRLCLNTRNCFEG